MKAGGVCAGVVAAAAAVAGPRASVRVVSTFEDVWEATGAVGKRSLAAVGSSGLPGADGPGSFRVSELFEVAVPPSGTYSNPRHLAPWPGSSPPTARPPLPGRAPPSSRPSRPWCSWRHPRRLEGRRAPRR
ncbi:unnamed protein product [Prorocentrum cordatum]|uniref:Uncharacterized protein n=1 Tax=Prorocentrum cordatum TaxID=2364126 RepID=A0ABN9S538_9DINO|nr:unnamed protein product [Polarella glacialis]